MKYIKEIFIIALSIAVGVLMYHHMNCNKNDVKIQAFVENSNGTTTGVGSDYKDWKNKDKNNLNPQ